jgi:thioredoxin-like negative regulator of GroEL
VVEAFAKERDLPLRQSNVDTEPSLAAAFDVRTVPTLIVLRDGVEVGRTGLTTAEKLAELVS